MSYLNESVKSKTTVFSALANLRASLDMTNMIDMSAGFPGQPMPKQVIEAINKNNSDKSPCVQFEPKLSPLNESTVKKGLSELHEKLYSDYFSPSQILPTLGSSHALDMILRAVHPQGTKPTVLSFSPFYVLFRAAVAHNGQEFDDGPKLVTNLDVKNGSLYRGNRWHLDIGSVEDSLERLRKNPKNGGAVSFYLNFPSNPTGYTPSLKKYKKLVEVFLNDIRERKEKGLRPIAIIEDMCYASMMFDNKPYHSIYKAITALRTEFEKSRRTDDLELLDELEQNIITANTFSKTFSLAGHRVGYVASKNKQIINALNTLKVTSVMSLPADTYSVFQGVFDATKDPKTLEFYLKDVVKSYQERVGALSEGLRDAFGEQSVSDVKAGIFCPLRVPKDKLFFDDKDLASIRQKISKLSDIDAKLLNQSLLPCIEAGKNGKYPAVNSIAGSLWMLEKANVYAVPLQEGEHYISLRFAVSKITEKEAKRSTPSTKVTDASATRLDELDKGKEVIDRVVSNIKTALGR